MKHLITLTKFSKPVMAVATAAIIISGLTLSTPAHASKVKFAIAPGNLFEALSQSYDRRHEITDGALGYGLILDFSFGGKGSFSLDYYTMGESKTTFRGETFTDSTTAIFFGGRHHFDSGFYIGGGGLNVAWKQVVGSTSAVTDDSSNWLAGTLGYDHIFANNLIVGFNYMRSLWGPDGRWDHYEFQSIAFTVGYDW